MQNPILSNLSNPQISPAGSYLSLGYKSREHSTFPSMRLHHGLRQLMQ